MARILVVTVSCDCGGGHESTADGGSDTSNAMNDSNSGSSRHGNSGNIIKRQ